MTHNKKKIQEGQLRIWHIPQVPMKAFYVDVQSESEAMKILNTLWDYDCFQFENKIKPDYSNASGLEIYEDKEWCEWNNNDGDDICEIMRGVD